MIKLCTTDCWILLLRYVNSFIILPNCCYLINWLMFLEDSTKTVRVEGIYIVRDAILLYLKCIQLLSIQFLNYQDDTIFLYFRIWPVRITRYAVSVWLWLVVWVPPSVTWTAAPISRRHWQTTVTTRIRESAWPRSKLWRVDGCQIWVLDNPLPHWYCQTSLH